MTQELSGKTALVTGAASGIGAACAIELAEAGATLILADRDDLSATLAQITEQGSSAHAVTCDVSDEAKVASLFDVIEDKAGRLDIALNCAGILAESNLVDMSVDTFDRIISVNLRGTFLIGRGAISMMCRNGAEDGNCRMINFASELAYPGRAGYSAYCASKAGVIGLTRSWAREYAPGILVNAIAPGPIDTPMLGRKNMSAEWLEKEADVPLGRIGQPREISSVARFLAGPGAGYMTGQTISPNGGAVMF